MSEPIVFNLAAAQEAQNRLDDGLFTDKEKPRLMELAAKYEGWCQQEYGRFQEETERAERARWLARQCGGCVDGGTGELCEEHWLASASEAELAAIDADGSPGDLYDEPPVGEPVCDTCRIAESRWPVDHPLHVEGSGQCAWCRQADIEEDTNHKRREG